MDGKSGKKRVSHKACFFCGRSGGALANGYLHWEGGKWEIGMSLFALEEREKDKERKAISASWGP